ncbi:hypothetical protein RGR602_PC00411 (plasmid) [Rhizobium gallicum bv. gallicum R602sp]|uniref:Uncharacterized protein n=1 Tax=Rhizobium gallicum bv. gallicum R602sp TaxID=1041138 RepID=A0A0B4XBL5_9HYPH|nr:hypothetical protein RGR602_PC00411 [Rhizobium gallicum bv. gallicum R602sp]
MIHSHNRSRISRIAAARSGPACVKARGYEKEDFLDGVVIAGASAMHAEITEGAATLSF